MIKYTVTVDNDGTKTWYLNDKLHRTDGPAVEYADGTKSWYLNGKRHRTDGPAVEFAYGSKYWCVNDKLHRTDGPAIEYADGSKRWYLDGVCYTEAKWRKELDKRSKGCDGKVVEIEGKRYKLVAV